MRYALMNLIACPMCKHFPLKLYVFEERVFEKEYEVSVPFCDVYCGRKGKNVSELKQEELNCKECVKHDVVAGLLICPKCGRWYPIINGIPLMYPDSKRKHPKVREKEEEFLRKYREKLPAELRSITS